jgi:sodium/bile acid cotransporter 7
MMMIGKKTKFWVLMAVVVVTATVVAAGDRTLTDDEKREVVDDMYRTYKTEEFPDVRDISPEELMSSVASGNVVIVDARQSEEMEVSMLPGAIARQEFLENLDDYRGETIVAYCTISYRSGLFAREMRARGVEVLNLEGGILAWTLAGGKVYDKDGESSRIHVHGDKWNYAPDGYEAVTFSLLERIF